MSNKTNIEVLEEMKYQLEVRNKKIENDIYDNEIFASEYEDNNQKIQAIENILADRERLQSKANAYDSLVEKIELNFNFYDQKVKDIRESNIEHNNATKYDYLNVGKRDAFQELLEKK